MLSSEQFIQETLFAPRRERGQEFPREAHEQDEAAPHGYYRQPVGHQLVLPGMKMSPQEHVRALGRATGTDAHLADYGGFHGIELHHPERDRKVNASPLAQMEWAKRGVERWEAQPGEIGMIHTEPHLQNRGVASAMFSTAEAIAREHPSYSTPKHSGIRSRMGVQWSRSQMRKRGQQVW
jgi:GNAT superfamily N-acetyltransferase